VHARKILDGTACVDVSQKVKAHLVEAILLGIGQRRRNRAERGIRVFDDGVARGQEIRRQVPVEYLHAAMGAARFVQQGDLRKIVERRIVTGIAPDQTVAAGGVASGTILDAAAFQFVSGLAVGTVVSAGDQQIVESGGFASGTTVSSGGLLTVSSGGFASGATVSNGGAEILSAGGSASGTRLLGGGAEIT